MLTEREVLDTLNETSDPEIGIGIVDLGLIADLVVDGEFVRVTIRTTTPRCPFQPFIMMEAHRKLVQLSGIRGAEVEISTESPWHPEMMSESAKTRLGFLPSRLEMASRKVPEITIASTGRRM